MLDIIYFYFDIVYLCISTTYNLFLSNISGYNFAYVKYCMSHEVWHLKYNIPAIIVFIFIPVWKKGDIVARALYRQDYFNGNHWLFINSIWSPAE